MRLDLTFINAKKLLNIRSNIIQLLNFKVEEKDENRSQQKINPCLNHFGLGFSWV
jgi:hypothetical protein